MDTKAIFNLFLEFSKQHSASSCSGNMASAGDFEKFNMLMKWMNKEGTTKDDLPEGPVSQSKLGGSHSEHDLMHEEEPNPMQADDSSENSTSDSSSEKGSEEGGMYSVLQVFITKSHLMGSSIILCVQREYAMIRN